MPRTHITMHLPTAASDTTHARCSYMVDATTVAQRRLNGAQPGAAVRAHTHMHARPSPPPHTQLVCGPSARPQRVADDTRWWQRFPLCTPPVNTQRTAAPGTEFIRPAMYYSTHVLDEPAWQRRVGNCASIHSPFVTICNDQIVRQRQSYPTDTSVLMCRPRGVLHAAATPTLQTGHASTDMGVSKLTCMQDFSVTCT